MYSTSNSGRFSSRRTNLSIAAASAPSGHIAAMSASFRNDKLRLRMFVSISAPTPSATSFNLLNSCADILLRVTESATCLPRSNRMPSKARPKYPLIPRIRSLVFSSPSTDTATFVIGESLQSVRLNNDALKRGCLGLFQHLKHIFAEEGFPARQTQGTNTGTADFIHQSNGTICVNTVLPASLPVIATDAARLAVLCKLDVRR